MRNTPINTQSYYVGLDLSLSASGVVVLDAKGSVKERHVISFPKLRGAERLSMIQRSIQRILKPYLNIKLICIEGYSTGSVGKTFHIGELGGVIRVMLFRLGIAYIDPKPTQVKKFATGKGGGEGGSKDQVTMHVFKNWGFEAKDNNEADAMVLAQIALGLNGIGTWNSFQKEVIAQIKNPPEKKPKKRKVVDE